MANNITDIFIEEDGKVVLAKDYLRTIPEFRTLLEKKVLQKGDVQGALKKENFKWFVYIKIVADLFSFPNQEGLGEKDVRRQACIEAGFPEDYKPDEDIEAAIVKYKQIQKACLPTLSVLNSTLRALNLSDQIVKGITVNMEVQLEMFNKGINKEQIDEKTILENMVLLNSLIEQIDKVNKLAITIPKTVEVMESLRDKIKREQAGTNVARGGRELSYMADERN